MLVSSFLPLSFGGGSSAGGTTGTSGTTGNEFTTCHTCEQVHNPPCANGNVVTTQCGSEDWTGGSYIGCKDFKTDTWTCPNGSVITNTREVHKDTWSCMPDPNVLTAACAP